MDAEDKMIKLNKSILIILGIFLSLIVLPGCSETNKTNNNQITGNTALFQPGSGLETIKLRVNIPCPGHAFLIIDALERIGAENINFRPPNIFIADYDTNRLTKEQILNIDLFDEYSATEIK